MSFPAVTWPDKKTGDQFSGPEATALKTAVNAAGAAVTSDTYLSGLGSLNDGAIINAAIQAMPARGGILHLPAGTLQITETVLVDRPVLITAGGQQSAYLEEAGTLLTTPASLDIDAIKITSFGVTATSLGARALNTYNGASRAGRGWVVDIQKPHPTNASLVVGSSFSMSFISANGFDIGLDVVNGFESFVTGYNVQNCRTACLRLADRKLVDAGDNWISGGQIMGGSYPDCTGILQTSGGGLKLTGLKINDGRMQDSSGVRHKIKDVYAYKADYTDNSANQTAATVDLLACLISAENYTGHLMVVDSLPNVTICGPIQLAPDGSSVSPFLFRNCDHLLLNGVNYHKSSNDSMTYFAEFENCDKLSIGPNQTWDFPVPYLFTNCGTNIEIIGRGAAASTSSGATSTPAGQTLQYGVLDFFRNAPNIAFSSAAQGLQLTETTGGTTGWPGAAYGKTSIAYCGTPGLQGKLRLNQQNATALNGVMSLNTFKATTSYEVQQGIYFGPTFMEAIYGGTQGGTASSNTITESAAFQYSTQTAGFEIHIYDTKALLYYAPDGTQANVVLLGTYTFPTPLTSTSPPFIPTQLLRGGASIVGMDIAGYNLVSTPA